MGAPSASAPMGARPVSILTIMDTDILIDAGQDVPEAVECLAHVEEHSMNQRDYRFINGLQLLAYPLPRDS